VALLEASYTTVATAQIMSTGVEAVAARITFVEAKVAHLVAVVVQDLLAPVQQILEDLTQTPFTDLAAMAAEDRLDLLIL
jgi:hypothetical protein